jgi:hypothetical protein
VIVVMIVRTITSTRSSNTIGVSLVPTPMKIGTLAGTK